MHDHFRGQNLKRGYAQFGHAYISTGRKVSPALRFPPFLVELVAKAVPTFAPGVRFDQSIIAHYPASAGISWLTDAAMFGYTIIAASLGSSARLQLRRNDAKKYRGEASASIPDHST